MLVLHDKVTLKGILCLQKPSQQNKRSLLHNKIIRGATSRWALMSVRWLVGERESSRILDPLRCSSKIFHQSIFSDVHNVIDDAMRAFCHSISSHHHIRATITFHHILHILQICIVGALRYSSSLPCKNYSDSLEGGTSILAGYSLVIHVFFPLFTLNFVLFLLCNCLKVYL